MIDGVQEDDGAAMAAAALTILVVDDDPHINRLVQTRLAARGYQVTTALNGEEALAQVVRAAPDVIFLDVAMPGINGLDVLDQVRQGHYDVAVIMMTAYGSEQVVIDALRRGADDYLRKPFERAEFQAVLDRTVQRLLLGRQNATLRRQLEQELARAAIVQAELLPHEYPALAGFELAARCVPARNVGGDFYDWQEPRPGILTFTLADIMGKGMPAALWMATVRAAMRAVVRQSPPGEAMRYVAGALDSDLSRSGGLVTLFLGRLDVNSCRLQYVDAGHGHLFLRRANGEAVELLPRSLPLGALTGDVYTEGAIDFAPEDALILYSDGLTDARPELDLSYARLAAFLDGAASAEEMVERLVGLAAMAGPLPDDLTVVIVRRLAA